MRKYKRIKKCRSCNSKKLTPILNLGKIYVSDFVASFSKRGRIPLELILCEDCNLLQLRHTTNPDLLYREYWYKSSINETIIADLKDITSKAEEQIKLKEGDIVIDIGCNDGTLLRSYKTKGLKLVGFEPALNLIKEAKQGTTKIIPNYFSFKLFRRYFNDHKAKVATSIAVFYDLDNPNKFVDDITKCLDKEGLWIIEMRYLPLMLQQNDIGNCCHEHVEYYSLISLKNLLDRHSLEIVDVELNDVNGGSLRAYIRFKNKFPIHPNVNELLEKEKKDRLNELDPYSMFAYRVYMIKQELYDFIKKEHDAGKKIFVYGASTKGNTMLQYFGIDHKLIEAAAERDSRKFGMKTIATEIPIISEEEARKNADYFLILPWHFLDAFIKREKEFLSSGGKFIVPLPEFKVLP